MKPQELPRWRWDNVFTMLVTLLVWAFSFGILYQRVDYIAKNMDTQNQMWLQLERRVGIVEVGQATQDTEIRQVMVQMKLQ